MNYPANISVEEIESLEFVDFKDSIIVVTEQDEKYSEAMDYLSLQKVLGFDTETKPNFHAGSSPNRIAMLQLSGMDKAYLFRINKLGLPSKLVSILSNPSIIKVGAAIKDDLKGLIRYHKFVAKGFVDLQSMVKCWGIEVKSVKKMSAIILGKRISKAQQLSNWEAPQLSGAQLRYAATDAYVCREMYLKLISEK